MIALQMQYSKGYYNITVAPDVKKAILVMAIIALDVKKVIIALSFFHLL